jgi:hypothetical protein
MHEESSEDRHVLLRFGPDSTLQPILDIPLSVHISRFVPEWPTLALYFCYIFPSRALLRMVRISLSLSNTSNMVCPTWFITVQWAALLDIDEYVSLNKGSGGQKLESERAADRFDKLNGNGENAILFSWLNFLVKNSSRSLTRSVMRHRMPVLRDPSDKSVNCYKWPPQDLNGKAALKCDEGLGFTIHRAVQLPPKASMNAWSRDIFVLSPDLRAWHPRLRSSQGKCEHIVDTT